jgi:type IV secretory pathway VirB2 component (pilin)
VKPLWFLLAVVQAVVGGMALLRCGDSKGMYAFVYFVVGILFLFGAWQSIHRARGKR